MFHLLYKSRFFRLDQTMLPIAQTINSHRFNFHLNTMCFHRRLVFSCNHHAWLGITRPCPVEESFNRGEIDMGCSVQWSHGFDTIRIQSGCPKCLERQTGEQFRLGLIKDQIKVLKDHLMTIKGEEAIKDGDWLSLDSVLENAKSDKTSPSAVTENTDDTLAEELL